MPNEENITNNELEFPTDLPDGVQLDPGIRSAMHLFLLLDTSGTMSINGRIDALNHGVPAAIKAAYNAAQQLETELDVRVIQFASDAAYIFGSKEKGDSPESINWTDLTASGGTNTAAAIDLCRECMSRKILGKKPYNPVVVLITDGLSNDPKATQAAADRLKSKLFVKEDGVKGDNAVWTISIGVQDANQEELEYFAMKGSKTKPDGAVEDNVPMVFNVTNISELEDIMKKVVLKSVTSSITTEDNGTILI